MLEVGCGEGAVLQILLEPPSHADCFPPSSLVDNSGRIDSIPPAQEKELHLARVIGLDVQREVLDLAVRMATPSSEDMERWNELTLELYEGSLDVHNDAFEGVDAIIATEVIEHLFPVSLVDLSCSQHSQTKRPRHPLTSYESTEHIRQVSYSSPRLQTSYSHRHHAKSRIQQLVHRRRTWSSLP